MKGKTLEVGALSERPLDPVGGVLGERPYENDLTGRPNPEIGSDEAFDTAPSKKCKTAAVRKGSGNIASWLKQRVSK